MERWQYDTAADLDQTLVERLRTFPRQPDMLVSGLRLCAGLAMRSYLKLYHRLRVRGREHLPSDGSFVLVANHASHLDALALITALPLSKSHRVFPAAAEDYFFVSVPRVTFAAIVVNALPFDREVHVHQSLSLCRRLLENAGNVLVVFPEGTRSVDGRPNPFKAGVGVLVAGKPWPVIPCYLDGAHAAWPKGACIPRPRKLALTIGEPRTYEHLRRRRGSAEQITRELEDAVFALGPAGRRPADTPPNESESS